MSKEDKKLIQLYVSKDTWDKLRIASDSVEEPITTWVRRAVFASLRNWQAPVLKKENWPKCSICLKRHDEAEHFPVAPV